LNSDKSVPLTQRPLDSPFVAIEIGENVESSFHSINDADKKDVTHSTQLF